VPNISLFTGCDFGNFVASLNKHMPYKCTMIVDFLCTNCREYDVCTFIIYMWILFNNFAFNPNEEFMWKLEIMDWIFIWWALNSGGLSFRIIELQTQSSGYIFVYESIGWNYNYLGLQFRLNYYSIHFATPAVTYGN
jgi:hypothetical protein